MSDGVARTELAVMTKLELAELIEQAIVKAIDTYVAKQPPPERLLRSSEMSERLAISEQQLGILCRDGCPHALVGDRQRRFNPDDVLTWLRERGTPARVRVA